MWIDVKTNTPNNGDVVLVRMNDGTAERKCFAVAEYNPDASPDYRFVPVNCHSSYDGAGVPVLDFPVVSWRHLPV